MNFWIVTEQTGSNGNFEMSFLVASGGDDLLKCTAVILEFIRKNGVEYCENQAVMGDFPASAVGHVNFLKDNFKSKAKNSYYKDIDSSGKRLNAFFVTPSSRGWGIQYVTSK